MKNSLTILLLLALFVSSCKSRKTTAVKEPSKHQLLIAESMSNKTPLVSMDTFYCSGIKYAVIRESKSADAPEYYFKDLKNGDTLIKVKSLKDGSAQDAVRYDNYYFPDLKSSCDVISKNTGTGVYETICKFRLLNNIGLDTFRVETFVTINGSYEKKAETSGNFAMVERNRNADIYVIGNDIYQDSLIIGSFDENSVQSPAGGVLNQVQVYNKQKQIVSFSTETVSGSHEWRMATNSDGKYHLIKADGVKNNDLREIISFLIKNRYL